uniref:Uncharacterized protein n=1 Tax=Aegilops tauschii subsp. strangulata TaxID=200361 RepID=A0A453BEQ6_AEGTS
RISCIGRDRWGKDYTLDWNSGRTDENPTDEVHRDILIWSKIVRSRPGVCSTFALDTRNKLLGSI